MRERFIKLAEEGKLPFARVCARFGISRKTGYKWLNRFRAEGPEGLLERDRKPHSHPRRTAPEIEKLVGDWLAKYPQWTNGRLRRELMREEVDPLPAITTIEAIRRRLTKSDTEGSAAPNDGWGLAIGPVTVSGGLNHRAYVLRDRATGFVLAAEVVPERSGAGCRDVIWRAFKQHGLPRRLCWPGDDLEKANASSRHTALTVEVMRLGVAIDFVYAQPVAEVDPVWADLQTKLRGLPAGGEMGSAIRRRTDPGRTAMPLERIPQEALVRWRGRLTRWADQQNGPQRRGEEGRTSAAALYRPSPRRLESPGGGPDIKGAVTRRVSEKGIFHFEGRRWLVGRAFAGESVALRRLADAGEATVYFSGQPVGWVRACADGEDADQGLQPVDSLECPARPD